MNLKAIYITLAASLLSTPLYAASNTGPVKVLVTPVTLAAFQPNRIKFGKLLWKGGLKLSSADKRFGGFSGLALSKDGSKFVSISDRAWWLKGNFISRNGILSHAQNMHMAPLKIETRRKSTHWRDAESIAPWNARGIDGRLLVGFERRERILSYKYGRNGMASRPTLIKSPKAISSGPYNKELEALGRFYNGPRKNWLIAISEANLDGNGNIRGWMWRGKKTIPWSLKRFEDYDITDLAVSPDGKSFFTLERSFNPPNLPGFAIRHFKLNSLKHRATAKGELLFAGRQPFFAIDNMEGLALHKTKTGKLQLTVISDDNYHRALQSTLIFRFEINR